jgi:hypothetical protein
VNAVPRQTQLSVGPLIAAVGAVLLVVSLFLDWWEGLTAFTGFEFLDLLLLLLAVAVIASLASGLGLVRAPVSPGLALGVALFTVLLVLSQIVNDPPAVVDRGADKDIGIWLALSGSALMVAGAVLGYAHISLAVETRPRDAGAGNGPEPGESESGPTRSSAPSRLAHDDPTRPMSDPAAPRRPDDQPRP